jgi:Fe-S oxidoreductase/nitrate reductase gamma subunit
VTRDIFGNVSGFSKIVFYCAAVATVAVFVWGFRRRVRLWRLGKPVADAIGWRIATRNVLRYALLQERVRGRGTASAAHALLFGGFFVLFVGTVLIAVEHVLATALGRPAGSPVFHKGWYYILFEVVLDSAGLSLLAGCALFARRRLRGAKEPGRELRDGLVLGLLGSIGVTGYAVEGLRILYDQAPLSGVSYVGYSVARLLETASLTPVAAASAHVALWWTHAALSLTLIALFPWCRLLHGLAGAVRLAAGVEQLGRLSDVSIAQVEETGEIGVTRVEQFTRRQLIELDACVSCGRCEEQCPAFEAGKPLSPRNVVQDIRRHLETVASLRGKSGAVAERDLAGQSLLGDVIAEETLWSCTACSACVDVCPLGVSPLGFLFEMRRGAIADGKLRGSPAAALAKTGRSGNPWGLPVQDRLEWAADVNVPTVEDNPDFEVLYWVGCASAYDRRLQRVANSVVKLLTAARVNFAVLGRRERCTGEAARRMGDELLFQQLATENLATFSRVGLDQVNRRIVSHCPHCVNSFRLDYVHQGVKLNAVHHSEFLAELVRSGRLTFPPGMSATKSVTFHDPCYLARVWNVTDAPRQLIELSTAPGGFAEMPRRGRETACCGAGGGRMWFDDSPQTRIGQGRVDEALATGAETLAVACPFCLIMTSDGVAARGGQMEVRDLAEILADLVVEDPKTTGDN